MDVIGFLRVSLGSSTVLLHDSLGTRRICACSEAGFSSQNGDCLRSVLPNNSVLFETFMGKRLNVQNINKEMFLVYGGKCLWRKAVHSWVANISLMTKRLERK
jgi:hypothetical protein